MNPFSKMWNVQNSPCEAACVHLFCFGKRSVCGDDAVVVKLPKQFVSSIDSEFVRRIQVRHFLCDLCHKTGELIIPATPSDVSGADVAMAYRT